MEELLKARSSQFSVGLLSDSLTSTGTPLTSREAAALKKARRSSAISARGLKISSFTATPVSETLTTLALYCPQVIDSGSV